VEKLVILLPIFLESLLAPFSKVKQYENKLHYLTTASKSTYFSDGTAASYKGADKSLARPGRKQSTATEDFDVHISYL
jgi:hypothetical protein